MSLRAQLRMLNTSSDPAAAFTECLIVSVVATDSKPAHEVLKIKCTLCGVLKTWSSWKRHRGHLTGDDVLALGAGSTKCMNVPADIAEKFKKIMQDAIEATRTRVVVKRTEAAVNQAAASAALPSASKQQRSLESSFHTQSQDIVDQAVANCFYANDMSFTISTSVTFKRMIESVKLAAASYRPPDRHRFTDDLLTTTENRLVVFKAGALQMMTIFGCAVAVDAATVHGEPLVNCVTKMPTCKPIHLITINAKHHIAEGGSKDADFEANLTVTEIRKLPDGGIHVVLLTGDTAADEVLQSAMVLAVCPWMSYHPCTTHVCSLLLKKLAKIARIATWLEECNEITEWFRGHHATMAILDKYVRIHFPGVLVKRPFYAPDSRFAVQFLSGLRHLDLARAYQSAVTDTAYVSHAHAAPLARAAPRSDASSCLIQVPRAQLQRRHREGARARPGVVDELV